MLGATILMIFIYFTHRCDLIHDIVYNFMNIYYHLSYTFSYKLISFFVSGIKSIPRINKEDEYR